MWIGVGVVVRKVFGGVGCGVGVGVLWEFDYVWIGVSGMLWFVE